jgi:maltooligosyltrehalose synthase
VSGPDCDRILAFRRFAGREQVVVAVGRHLGRMTESGERWPAGSWRAELSLDRRLRAGLRDALSRTGAECDSLEISRLFAALPVAVLRNR